MPASLTAARPQLTAATPLFSPFSLGQLRLLHVWSLTATAAEQPGYYEELAAAHAGTATTVPVTEAIPDWAERVAAARSR